MKKGIYVLLVVLMLLALPVVAMAAETDEVAFETPDIYFSTPKQYKASALENRSDVESIREYIIAHAAKCEKSFDISQFGISIAYKEDLQNLIWYETPELFHCYELGFSDSSGIFTMVHMRYRSYADTPEEYQYCMNAISNGANKILEGIKGNNQLNDVNKALLLHDRLALWTEYDMKNFESNTLPETVYVAYGALGEQVAVCQGYALAYMYLLKQVGIESDLCMSDALDHAWNIVYIDGKTYHVDVTWDDPTWDTYGYVTHDNFLRSSDGIRSTGHYAYDYDTRPTSTTYDSYYWQNSWTAFQLVNGKIYYIDSQTEQIMEINGGFYKAVYSVADTWEIGGGYYYSGLAKLGSGKANLLFSLSDGVYSLDMSTWTAEPVFRPSLSGYMQVYGFKYEAGRVYCDIYNTANFDGNARIYAQSTDYNADSNLSGWYMESGCWYFYENGIKVKNDWRKDSKGWCYLTGNGAMATNAWAQDSKGWCYVGADGYCVTNTWKRDSVGWVYLDREGSMVKNDWVLTGGKWYYLDSRGYMVSNEWRQDSKGWCYLTDTGAMATNAWVQDSYGWVYLDREGSMVKNDWVLYKGRWYYLDGQGYMVTNEWRKDSQGWCWLGADGAMVTNSWVKDSKGWCYIGADGYCWTNCWAKDSIGWVYLDQEGSMVYSQWIQEGSKRYYIGANGYMLCNTVYCGYRFDANGVCLNP